jgi:hypothetical protein
MRVRTVPVTVSPSLSAARRPASFAAGLLFENDAAIDDDVFIGDVELGDAAGDLWPTRASSSAASRVPLRLAGMKARTPTSTLRPPLMTAVTVPATASLFGEGALEGGPVAGLRDAESARARSSPLRCGR